MDCVRLNSAPKNTMVYNINNTLVWDRSQPGLRMTMPTVGQWDVGDKYATGVQKINET